MSFKGAARIQESSKKALENANIVFHFAANPEVRLRLNKPKSCFRNNIYATYACCVEAVLTTLEKSETQAEVFNVEPEDQVEVKEIAEVVTKRMKLRNVCFTFTGCRAWVGDIENMLLDITKLKLRGWLPKYNSKQAVECAIESLVESYNRAISH